MPELSDYADDYILMHPLRRRIIDELKEGESYTAKLARDLGMERSGRLIGFHLTILARNGFVEGEFRLANPADCSAPKAVKYYHLTEKTVSTLKKMAEELSR